MNSLVNPFLLIADARIEAVHNAFNTRKTDMGLLLFALMIFVVMIGGLVGGIYLRKRFLSKPLLNPRRMFLQLCRAHHLKRSQRQVLQQLGDILGLPTPSFLILDAGVWKLEELLRSQKINPKKFEQLQTLQRTLYLDPKTIVP